MSFLLNPHRFAAAGSNQPDPGNVSLLLHGEGTDGATGTGAFVDSSQNGFTPSAAGGSVEIDTAQFKFGSASIWFHGSRIDYAHNAAFGLGGADFNIEAFIRFDTVSAQTFLSRWTTAGNQREYIFDYNGTNLRFVYSGDGSASAAASGAWSPSADTWYHVAASRSGSIIRVFADGVELGDNTFAGNINFQSQALQLGVRTSSVNLFNGWMDELRFVKGEALYTGNFTPPTSAHPNP